MWIHATRDPKKKWLEIQFCVSIEEVEWIIKYLPTLWKVPAVRTTNKPKEKIEASTSTKTNSSTKKTKNSSECAQASGSSTTMKNPSRKETMFRAEVKGDVKNGETY